MFACKLRSISVPQVYERHGISFRRKDSATFVTSTRVHFFSHALPTVSLCAQTFSKAAPYCSTSSGWAEVK